MIKHGKPVFRRGRAHALAELKAPSTRASLAIAGALTLVRYGAAVALGELEERRKQAGELATELEQTKQRLWALETVLANRQMVTLEELGEAYLDAGRKIPENPAPTIAEEAPEAEPAADVPAGAVPVSSTGEAATS